MGTNSSTITVTLSVDKFIVGSLPMDRTTDFNAVSIYRSVVQILLPSVICIAKFLLASYIITITMLNVDVDFPTNISANGQGCRPRTVPRIPCL